MVHPIDIQSSCTPRVGRTCWNGRSKGGSWRSGLWITHGTKPLN